MRLIDADVLKEILINKYEAREHYIGEIMLKAIDNAPTVEAVPLKFHEKVVDKTIKELFECQAELERVRNELRQIKGGDENGK